MITDLNIDRTRRKNEILTNTKQILSKQENKLNNTNSYDFEGSTLSRICSFKLINIFDKFMEFHDDGNIEVALYFIIRPGSIVCHVLLFAHIALILFSATGWMNELLSNLSRSPQIFWPRKWPTLPEATRLLVLACWLVSLSQKWRHEVQPNSRLHQIPRTHVAE